jgi:hypothetical protein
MRKLLLFLFFILSFSLFLYLTFPLERVIESNLCKEKISFRSLTVRKFPSLEVVVEDVKYQAVPFTIKKVIVFPEVSTIFSDEKLFNVKVEICNGDLEGVISYPLSRVDFEIKKVSLKDCEFHFPFRMAGILYGKGNLVIEKDSIVSGTGRFKANEISLQELDLSTPFIKDIHLQDVKFKYKVKDKNVVDLQLHSKNLSINGYVKLNTRDFMRSYLSLKAKLKFNGQEFSFKIRGTPDNLGME